MRRRRLLLFCAVPLAASFVSAQQQTGSIRGLVTDKDFDAPLAQCKVKIVETGAETLTTAQGNFLFSDVPVGTYTLLFSKDGYVRQERSAVRVAVGSMQEVSVALAGDFTDMEELVVEDVLRVGDGSEESLLQLRFESSSLIDSIGADLMSRAGASDAAAALSLVSGATVQDGKFAVVRGLPDRYVVSLLNGVRLPSADEKTRAVELDQFPSAVIESVRVSKTFMPDQQGDASGGAVDVRLKGIPDEPFLFRFDSQLSFNTQVGNRTDFLTYDGGGVSFSGKDDGGRGAQTDRLGENWTGAAGVSERAAPVDSKWSIATGGNFEIGSGVRVGGLLSAFYERDSSFFDNGVDDSYWIESPGDPLTPRSLQGTPTDGDFKTALFDVTEASELMQRGIFATAGIEWEQQSIGVAVLRSRTTEDKATLAQDTRGKEFYFPGHDPEDPTSPGSGPDEVSAAPYIRTETLEYTERVLDSLIFFGDHEVPLGEWRVGDVAKFTAPKLHWSISRSKADLDQPDKRQFGALWTPATENPGAPPFVPPFTVPATWVPFKPAANFNLGNFQRIYKRIEEESDQYAVDLELPFEQWGDLEGYWKFGYFEDRVKRQFDQDTFSNFGDAGASYVAGFDEPWSAVFPFEDHPITESLFDVDYDGAQKIKATYLMLDLPLHEQWSIVGGVRFETTDIRITNDPEADATWFPVGATAPTVLSPGDADVDFDQDDVLPAVGLVYTPSEAWTVRAAYSETVARQTFRELTPILQQEFLGGPVFIGNPLLEMASLENYDLRVDYEPRQGSLISASYFYKNIDNPIEFVQRIVSFDFTTAVNYPSGTLEGWEFELRQDVGALWEPLQGLSIGGNATMIDSEVDLPADEIAAFSDPRINSPRTKRDAVAAPEYLLNLNLTYDLPLTGTQFGVFYTVTGDTLLAGAGESDGNLVPDVYAKRFDNLNLSVTQPIGPWCKLRLQAKNVTDPEIDTEYRPADGGALRKTSFTRGIEYSISIGGQINF